MTIRTTLATFLFVALCSISFQSVIAETSSEKVVIVLDASGSMWGQVSGEVKMQAAKRVVKDLLQDWDPSVEIGLTAYGHRRKGDCADIQSLVPVAQLKHSQFISAIDGITPKGKTPLSEAVQRAAKELRFEEDRATVILVSDGIETCDRNPCAVAEKLESMGVDFTTHVVGFDVNKEKEIAELRCMAEKTGGKFLSAKDATSLQSALQEAVKEVKRLGTAVDLVAVHAAGGEALKDVSWQVFDKPGNPLQKAKVVAYGSGATPRYRLEPGEYTAKVRSRSGKAVATKDITVVTDQIVREEVVLAEEGLLALSAVAEAGGSALQQVAWQVFSIESDPLKKPKIAAYGSGETPEYRLLPGRYLAKVRSLRGKAVAEKEVEVKAGERVTEQVLMPKEGRITLVAVGQSGGDPIDDVTWKIYNIETDPLKRAQVVTYGKGAQPTYQLLPGKYLAHAKSRLGKAEARQEIEVMPGEAVRAEVIFPIEGVLELRAVHAADGEPVQGVAWHVYSIEKDPLKKPELVTYGKGDTPRYKLLPGKYMAQVKSRKGKVEVKGEVEVLAGQLNVQEVIIPQEGVVALKAVRTAGGDALDKVRWELLTIESDPLKKPVTVHYGGGVEPRYQVLPGKYVARVTMRSSGEKFTQEVEARPGELVQIEVLVAEKTG